MQPSQPRHRSPQIRSPRPFTLHTGLAIRRLCAKVVLLGVALGLASCTQTTSRDTPEAGAPAVRVPARSGEVWEVDRPTDRATAPGAVLAFVTGLHVMIVDADQVFAGMTRLETTQGPAGARVVALGNGLSAEIMPAGDRLELRFSTGESIAMRKQAESKKTN